MNYISLELSGGGVAWSLTEHPDSDYFWNVELSNRYCHKKTMLTAAVTI